MRTPNDPLVFRGPADPSLWDPSTPGALLTSVSLRKIAATMAHLKIAGIARNTPTFDIVATSRDADVRTPVSTAGVTAFEAMLALDVDTDLCTLAIERGGETLDRAVFRLPDLLRTALPEGRIAGLGPDHARFLSGTPDRSVERRSFSLLMKPMSHVFPGLGPGDMWSADPGHLVPVAGLGFRLVDLLKADPLLIAPDAYRPAYANAVRELLTQRAGANHGIDLARELDLRRRLAFDASKVPWTDSLRARIGPAVKPVRRKAKPGTEIPAQTLAAYLGIKRLPEGVLGAYIAGSNVQYLVIAKDAMGLLYDALAEADLTVLFGDVGILFNDRLRFRPSGLVVGEPIYTLALAPGEEVQVRQTVETKRRATMEGIEDREQESGLTLSSTWSTDIADSVTDTSNFQSGMQLNEGLNAAPAASAGIPIGGTAGITASASEAYTLTRQETTRNNRQLTAQATAKMRRQHKTRIEITTEQSSGLATTRTVRNANQQRPVTYVFSKMYRREQVLLERYGARLCLRWVVDDPARIVRKRFMDHIDRMDPDLITNYGDVASLEVMSTTEDVEVSMESETRDDNPSGKVETWPSQSPPGPSYRPLIVGVVDHVLSKSRSDVAVPDDYRLLGSPVVTFSKMRIRDEGPTRGDAARRDSQSSDEWLQIERSLFYRLNDDRTGGAIHINAHAEYNHIPGNRFDGRLFLYGPTKVTVRITATWAKSTAREIAEQEPVAARRRDLERGLTVERLTALRDMLASDYAGGVMATAVRSALGDIGTENANMVRTLFAFEDAIVENIPYWATSAGRNAQRELQDRLQSLPIPLPTAAFMVDELTASQAIVYLPIRDGAEEDALLTAAVVDDAYARSLAEQIHALRSEHFAAARTTTTGFDDVTGPVPPTGTPASASVWASDWERPLYRFDVLSAWSELVPTDGVHLDAVLSDTVATDEHRTDALARPAP
jgi:hypothetical protein